MSYIQSVIYNSRSILRLEEIKGRTVRCLGQMVEVRVERDVDCRFVFEGQIDEFVDRSKKNSFPFRIEFDLSLVRRQLIGEISFDPISLRPNRLFQVHQQTRREEIGTQIVQILQLKQTFVKGDRREKRDEPPRR